MLFHLAHGQLVIPPCERWTLRMIVNCLAFSRDYERGKWTVKFDRLALLPHLQQQFSLFLSVFAVLIFTLPLHLWSSLHLHFVFSSFIQTQVQRWQGWHPSVTLHYAVGGSQENCPSLTLENNFTRSHRSRMTFICLSDSLGSAKTGIAPMLPSIRHLLLKSLNKYSLHHGSTLTFSRLVITSYKLWIIVF